MTGRRFTRILLTGLTIFWMAFIFGMSGADGESSSGMSGAVCEFIADTVIEDFDEYSMSRQQEIISRMQFYVRKAAHMTEYAVLAILLPATLALYGVSGRTLLWLGPLLSLLYACTDEYHQTFVPDRSGSPVDVLIDSAGILAGSLLYLAVCRIPAARGQKKASEAAGTADGEETPGIRSGDGKA